MLTTDGSLDLLWTWAGSDPVLWRIMVSTDGGVTWSVFDTSAGVTREYDGVDAGKDYKIEGVDGSGNQVTDFSNVVST